MAGLKDMTGERFGRLTVVARADNTKAGQARWTCQCDCGKKTVVQGQALRDGRVVSCGCLKAQKASKRATERNTTHGKRHSRLYSIWSGIKQRTENEHHIFYDRYGGRGISICGEWKCNFQSFYDWSMSHGYADNLTIDRIDNNSGYSPDNCRWASVEEQNNNKESTRLFCINGVEKGLAEWCREFGVNYYTAWSRIFKEGWAVEKAVTTKVMETRQC